MPVQAKPADVKPGLAVRNTSGSNLGIVGAVGSGSAIVTTPDGSVRLPVDAFGLWCDGSLLLSITAKHFQKLVRDAQAATH